MPTCTRRSVQPPPGSTSFFLATVLHPTEPVSVISDDAGEFRKAVEGSQLARDKILDWFHIAMKFKAAENAVFGCKQIEPLEREAVKAEIRSAKWLVWHGKGGKAIARIKALDALLLERQDYEFRTLWWNLHGIACYLRNNAPSLVNYGARHRNGLPISSSIRRVGGQSSGEPAHGQETTDALDRRGRASSRAGQGCRAQRESVAKAVGPLGQDIERAFARQYAERGNAKTRRLTASQDAGGILNSLPHFCTHSCVM